MFQFLIVYAVFAVLVVTADDHGSASDINSMIFKQSISPVTSANIFYCRIQSKTLIDTSMYSFQIRKGLIGIGYVYFIIIST